MEAYQERVVNEKTELDNKIFRLKTFIDSDQMKSLTDRDWDLFILQLEAMQEYSRILGERILGFYNT